MKSSSAKEHVHYHKDGTVWARGRVIGRTPAGCWEWFRKDGTKLRSGYFTRGRQTGECTAYDRNGSL